MTQQAQASLADFTIEDTELEQYLHDRLDNTEAADKFGKAGRQIKELLKVRHPKAVNSDDDGQHTGWVRCGPFRFRPRNKYRAAQEVEYSAVEGLDWQPFDIEKLD